MTKLIVPATSTQERVLARMRGTPVPPTSAVASRAFRNNVLQGGTVGGIGTGTYSGSSVTPSTEDFLGDWRSADSWMRFDMWRVRNRSRQLERGNPWCKGFKRNILNNVLGSAGFHFKSLISSSLAYGDPTEGEENLVANAILKVAMAKFGEKESFTNRRRLDRSAFDRLILARLIFDGEVFLVKRKFYRKNDYGFTWQMIDPDYCDQNLNRVEPETGNITKMGIELEKDEKFPVRYWFLKRRPNDYFYNYAESASQRYVSYEAEDVIHLYMQDEDSEQTRGWPWPFAAVVNLHRMGKFEEAALLNAVIGARRGVYFTKDYPDGMTGTPDELAALNDGTDITQDIPEGSGFELPMGVKPYPVDMKYPDEEFEPFRNAMMLGACAVFGQSYASGTGDLSKANFVSSRLGSKEEQEQYMFLQKWLIDGWKRPGFREELRWMMLGKKVPFPIEKLDYYDKPRFTGRRWGFVQPVDDMKAKGMALDLCLAAPSQVYEEMTGGDYDELLGQIKTDADKMEKLGIKRVPSAFAGSGSVGAPGEDDDGDGGKDENGKAKKKD